MENDADVDVEYDKCMILFQIASPEKHHQIVQLLLDHRDQDHARIMLNT